MARTTKNRDYPEPDNPLMDSKVATIIVSIVTASIIFVGANMFSQKGNEGAVTVKLENLSTQISELKGSLTVLTSNTVRREELTAVDARLHDLETKVYKK